MTSDADLNQVRLLALDLRPHWLGFAFFDAGRLIDFGVTRFASLDTGTARLAHIMESSSPRLVALRGIATTSRRHQPRTLELIRTAERFAHTSAAKVVSVSELQIRRHFWMTYEARTKHQVAAIIATRFIDLGWKIPPRRRLWEHEHRNAPLFDAAALGLFCLDRCLLP